MDLQMNNSTNAIYRRKPSNLCFTLNWISGEMNSMLQSSSGSSSARDRTNEFLNTIRTLQGQQHGQAAGFNQQVSPQDRHGQLGKLNCTLIWNSSCVFILGSIII